MPVNVDGVNVELRPQTPRRAFTGRWHCHIAVYHAGAFIGWLTEYRSERYGDAYHTRAHVGTWQKGRAIVGGTLHDLVRVALQGDEKER